jgi:hypothetical protein
MADAVRPPTEEELAWLRWAEERVNKYLYRYSFDEEGEGRLDHTERDLQKIQEVFAIEEFSAIKEFTADQLRDMYCLGAALGNVLVAQTPMRWAVVTNEFGTNLAIHHQKTGFTLYPITMISKRVEGGRKVDVPALYRSFVELARTGGSG